MEYIEQVNGTNITIENSNGDCTNSVKLLGDIKQKSYSGKNLLRFNGLSTQTINGLTITNNNDGSITFNGTTTDTVSLRLSGVMNNLPAGSYTYKRNATGTLTGGVYSDIIYVTGNVSVSGNIQDENAKSFTTTSTYGTYWLWFYVSAGKTFTNYTIRPQLEKGSTATEWEPYVGGIPSPNPNYPQEIITVSGSNTITVSDGTNANEYTLDLGDLELCKIGDYQDYIYRDGVKWYLHKEITKTVLTGDETWTKADTRFHITLDDYTTGTYIAISDYFKSVDTWSQHTSTNYSIILYKDNAWSAARLSINDGDFASGTPFKQWLADNNVSVYYPSPDAMNTEITDVDLIKQLNELYNMKLPYGTIYITSQGDLPIILDINYNNWNKDINPSDRAALLDGTATIETEIRYNMNGAVPSECSYYEDDSPYFVSCEFVQIVPNHQYNVDLSDILSNDVEEIRISILYSKNTPTDFDELNEWADEFYNTGDTSNVVDIIDMNDYQESSILLTAPDDATFMSLLITIKLPDSSGGGGSLS